MSTLVDNALGHTLNEPRPYGNEGGITVRTCTRCGLHLYESADGRGGYAVVLRCPTVLCRLQPAKNGGML